VPLRIRGGRLFTEPEIGQRHGGDEGEPFSEDLRRRTTGKGGGRYCLVGGGAVILEGLRREGGKRGDRGVYPSWSAWRSKIRGSTHSVGGQTPNGEGSSQGLSRRSWMQPAQGRLPDYYTECRKCVLQNVFLGGRELGGGATTQEKSASAEGRRSKKKPRKRRNPPQG